MFLRFVVFGWVVIACTCCVYACILCYWMRYCVVIVLTVVVLPVRLYDDLYNEVCGVLYHMSLHGCMRLWMLYCIAFPVVLLRCVVLRVWHCVVLGCVVCVYAIVLYCMPIAFDRVQLHCCIVL